MTHGRAPGPGYALVVNVDGFRLDGEQPAVALSGEGVEACTWLIAHPGWVPDVWPNVGEYVKLPTDA